MKVLSLIRALPFNALEIIRRTPPLVFATTVLSIGGLIGFTSASKILVDGLKPAANSITVTGASTERIESDFAKWDIKVETTGNSQIDSYKKHKVSIEKTMTFLDRYDVKNNDYQSVALLPASTSKEINKNPKTGEIISKKWVTTQWIEIESNDVFNIDQTYSNCLFIFIKHIRSPVTSVTFFSVFFSGLWRPVLRPGSAQRPPGRPTPSNRIRKCRWCQKRLQNRALWIFVNPEKL